MSKLLEQVAKFTVDSAHAYDNSETPTKETRRWSRWDWSMGVGFYGVFKANEILKNDELIKPIDLWVKNRMGSLDCFCVNTCGVMPAVVYLAEKYGYKDYQKIIDIFDDYVMTKAHRTPCGAIAHSVVGGGELDGEIWADTLFMCILYMVIHGTISKNKEMVHEAGRQLLLHAEALRDDATNLYYHGYNDNEKKPMGVKWGRGNAWMIVASVEILNILGDSFSGKKKILEHMSNLLDALARYQNENGSWNTVIDDKNTYEEMTITAGTVYGTLRGIQLGYFDKKHEAMARKALAVLETNINSEGGMEKASTGTPIKVDALAYNNIPYHVTPFAQGLCMLALCMGEVKI